MKPTPLELIADFRQRQFRNGNNVFVLRVGAPGHTDEIARLFKSFEYRTLNNHNHADYKLPGHDWSVIPADYFDVILCVNVLEGDPLFWRTLHNMMFACKPGGHILILIDSEPGVERSIFYRFSPQVAGVWAKYMSCELVDIVYQNESYLGEIFIIFKKPE